MQLLVTLRWNMDASTMNVRLACALRLEAWAVQKAGLPTVHVGMGCRLGIPEGRVISAGFAGGLLSNLKIGTCIVANRIVDENGQTLWEGEPLKVQGATIGTFVSTHAIYDRPRSRKALYEQTGAIAIEMESHMLAGKMFRGGFRVISDSPKFPLAVFSVYGGLKALRELRKIRLETELW